MKKREFKTNEELRKEKKRLQSSLYYYSKKPKTKGKKRELNRKIKELKGKIEENNKQLKINEETRLKKYKHAVAQRKYNANKTLKEAVHKKGVTKRDLMRLFRKVVDANTEQKRINRSRGSKLIRKKGLVSEQRTVWEGKYLANDILEGKVNYKKYLGVSTKKNLDDLVTKINNLVLEMGSRDVLVLHIDPKQDNIKNIYVKKYDYEKE